MGAAAAGAIVARARRNIISHFMSRDAVSADKAVAFTPRRFVERRALERFLRAGVIVAHRGGRYHLNVPRYDEHRRTLRGRVGLGLALVAMAGGAASAILG